MPAVIEPPFTAPVVVISPEVAFIPPALTVNPLPAVIVPEALILPDTSNVSVGELLFIPTLGLAPVFNVITFVSR